jgi:putative sigma-54 modulation protein
VQVTIIGRHKEVPADVKSYIEGKAAKLPHYYDRVMSVQVILEDTGPLKKVELIVGVAGHEDFVAQEKGAELFACFDVCMDRMENQLRRFKEKIRDNKHKTPTSGTGVIQTEVGPK